MDSMTTRARPPLEYELQLDSGQRRVWVHCSDGSTVGRFNVDFGIDIHNTITDQMAGASECLHCTHRAATREDWALFREKAMQLWGLSIPGNAIDESGLVDV